MNRRKRTTPPIEPMLLTIPEVAAKLGLGRSKVYDLIRDEGLPIVKFGTAARVPVKELEQWVTKRIA
jgi:excisionase family DNA binding protein